MIIWTSLTSEIMTADYTPCKPFSVNVFYSHQTIKDGSRHHSKILTRHKKSSTDENALKETSVPRWPKAFCPRLLGPTICWKTFYRQSEAFEFAKQFPEDVYVFAFESATDFTLNKGQRKYLATSLPVFWHYYSQLSLTKKAHYEIIPEGSPCKLYFDLEFKTDPNPSSHGCEMTEVFIKYACSWLSVFFGITIDRGSVLDLDASTATKFSRHLIFDLPGAVFENNGTMGKFVQHIMAVLLHHVEKHSSSLDLSSESVHVFAKGHPLELSSPNMRSSSKNEGSNISLAMTRIQKSGVDVANDFFHNFHDGEDDEICLLEDSSLNQSNEFGCLASSRIQRSKVDVSNDFFDDFLDGEDDELFLLGDSSVFQLEVSDAKKMESSIVSCQSVQVCQDSRLCASNLGTPDLPCKLQKETVTTTLSEGKSTDDFNDEHAKKVLSLFSMKDLQTLFVRKKNGSYTCFCDLGVYTRNRNFRLYLSSKLNKQNPLLLAKENVYKPASKYETSECDVFYASLVTHVEICKDMQVLCFDGQSLASVKRKTADVMPTIKTDAQVQAENLEGCGNASPYPEVDAFITSLIASNGHSGSIRRWTYFTNTETLVYDISGYRWCANIGRQHKSNNIMYVTDLHKGVYYQKCHDPDCQVRQYRSAEIPLPRWVLPGFYFEDDILEGDVNNDFLHDEGIAPEDDLLVVAMEDVEILQELDRLISSGSVPREETLL